MRFSVQNSDLPPTQQSYMNPSHISSQFPSLDSGSNETQASIMRRVQLHEELVWEILEWLWNSPLSSVNRILLMKSSVLVSKSWSNIFAKVSLRDVHIPCEGYVGRYLDIIHNFKGHHNETCRSITIDPQKDPGTRLADILVRHKTTYTNLRTLRFVYDRFLIDDIFNEFQFKDFPDCVRNLELHFINDGTKLQEETIKHLSNLRFNVTWLTPHLRRLSIFGGDRRLLRHYFWALKDCQKLTILETDFEVTLEDIDLEKSSTLPTQLKHCLISRV